MVTLQQLQQLQRQKIVSYAEPKSLRTCNAKRSISCHVPQLEDISNNKWDAVERVLTSVGLKSAGARD